MKGRRALTRDEETAVMDAFRGRYALRNRALFCLMMKTGLRAHEARQLRVGDFIQDRTWTRHVTVRRELMKGKTEGRTVFLHPDARHHLMKWVSVLQKGSGMGDDVAVFLSREGGPLGYEQIWRIFKAAFRRARIDPGQLGTHSARKSYCERVHVALDRDLHRTRIASGHKSMSSLIRYLPVHMEEIDDAVMEV